MIAELDLLSQHADGVRCDMAMLALSDVFRETWNTYLRSPMPATEFWTDARSAVPSLVLLAEVYWDLGWRLQQLGFDFTYDKRLYDRLLHAPPAAVRGHLTADAGTSSASRDSSRTTTSLAAPQPSAIVSARRRPSSPLFPGFASITRGSSKDEPVIYRFNSDDGATSLATRGWDAFTSGLAAADDDVFHSGEWRLLEVHPAGDGTSHDLAAWRWVRDGELRIVAVNLGRSTAQGHVQVSSELPEGAGDRVDTAFVFEDLLDGERYTWPRHALTEAGLYVKLENGTAHVFRVHRRQD